MAMKESGIEWVGLIPDTWSVIPNKYVMHKEKNLCEKWTGEDVMSLTMNGVIVRDLQNPTGKMPATFDGYQYIEDGDLLMCLFDIDVTPRCVGRVTHDGVTSPAYSNFKVHDNASRDYFYYYYLTVDNTKELLHLAKNLRHSFTEEQLGQLKVPMPPLSEQQAIADYLDETCSKIDEIIAEAKASIDEYTTLKQALIAEITTNGLNNNVDYCETNFAWIGKIPTHWKLKPFKYILNERNEKNNPIKSTERLSLSIDKGITLYAEKTTNLDRFKDDFTAYKLAYKGDLVMNSMNMIVGASGVSDYFGCVSPVYYTYFDNESDHITAKYCEYLFRSRMLMRVLRSLGKGIHHIDRGDDRVNTCRLKISRDDLRALVLPVPPLSEQRDIVVFLDKKISEIDSLISEKQSLIQDLETYKKSLIYEVVTGKRRVV